jgi:ABC-type lipoprotein release transport system permease subunit
VALTRRWPSAVALVVLAGVLSGVVIAAVAGVRRTVSAPDRLIEAAGGEADAIVFDVGGADLDAIRSLPQVEHVSAVTFMLVDAVEPFETVTAFATSDPARGGLLVDGVVLDGRDPDTAMIDEVAARKLGLGPGGRFVLGAYTEEQFASGDLGSGPKGPRFPITVSGVLREPDDVSPGDPSAEQQVPYASSAAVYVPESFLEAHGDEVTTVNTLLGFDLVGGSAARPELVEAVRALPGGDTVQFFDASGIDPATRRAIDVQALALGVVAAVLGLVGIVVFGQALSRRLRGHTDDDAVLRSMGMRLRERVAVSAAQGVVVGVGAALVALVVAVAVSPLTPVGIARDMEPTPGVDVNLAVLALGAVGVVVVFTAIALLVGWRITRIIDAERVPRTRSSFARALRRGIASPSWSAGWSLADRGRGASAWSAVLGIVVGIMAVVAALTYVSSFDDLVAEPARYGWTFDAVAGTPFAGEATAIQERLQDTPGVSATARSGSVAVQSRGGEFSVVGTQRGTGITPAQLLEGRLPRAEREIALGANTLDDLDAAIGDTIEVDAGSGATELTVTGEVVVPEIAAAGTGYADGGIVTLATVRDLSPDRPPVVLLTFDDRIDAAGVDAVRDAAGGLLLEPVLPISVYDVERVSSLPVLLATLLAVLALALLVHTLVSVVRGGRHQIAVLKAIGFVRRQVLAGTVTLGMALVGLALVFGVPLGVALGRVIWDRVGDALGVPASPHVPAVAVALVVPLALLVAAAGAAFPAWLAARTRPAESLRVE